MRRRRRWKGLWGMLLVLGGVAAVLLLTPIAPVPSPAVPAPALVAPQPLPTQAMPPQLIERMRDLATQPSTPTQVQPAEPKAKPTAEPEPAVSHRYSGGGPTEKGPGERTVIKARPRPAVVRTGAVPELAIDMEGHSSEQVARHYGLVLAAQAYSAARLLGIFAEGQLVPLEQAALDRFARRGRSAAGVRDEFALRRRVAQQSGFNFDDIGLLYLVPRQVDRTWQTWQEEVVGAAGYTFAEVAAVRAGYGANLALEARALVLVDGTSVALK
ncbi:MAG: hypothetical protein GKR89_15775 [Candidatus Latescibacteria bacterium]|nr:hypothetical protein [Candidatus Latescibacterota bacterium]